MIATAGEKKREGEGGGKKERFGYDAHHLFYADEDSRGGKGGGRNLFRCGNCSRVCSNACWVAARQKKGEEKDKKTAWELHAQSALTGDLIRKRGGVGSHRDPAILSLRIIKEKKGGGGKRTEEGE